MAGALYRLRAANRRKLRQGGSNSSSNSGSRGGRSPLAQFKKYKLLAMALTCILLQAYWMLNADRSGAGLRGGTMSRMDNGGNAMSVAEPTYSRQLLSTCVLVGVQ